MENVLLVIQIIALVAATALCIFLIVVLNRVREVLTNIERDISTVTERSMPVLENLEYISSRVKNITDNIDDQVLIVRESIGSIREVADSVVDLERKVQARIEGPILDTVALIAALFKGVKTFTERLRA